MEDSFDIHDQLLNGTEREYENALRPISFVNFSGQDKVVQNLRVFVTAARMRGESLDHTLLHGPPGLGKTTLSSIIANELNVGFKVTSVSFWISRATWPGFSLPSKKTMCFSSTRFIACRPLWRNISTVRWRIFASTS